MPENTIFVGAFRAETGPSLTSGDLSVEVVMGRIDRRYDVLVAATLHQRWGRGGLRNEEFILSCNWGMSL